VVANTRIERARRIRGRFGGTIDDWEKAEYRRGIVSTDRFFSTSENREYTKPVDRAWMEEIKELSEVVGRLAMTIS
jgi:hypothetical protein